jgi:hypothetical protein
MKTPEIVYPDGVKPGLMRKPDRSGVTLDRDARRLPARLTSDLRLSIGDPMTVTDRGA